MHLGDLTFDAETQERAEQDLGLRLEFLVGHPFQGTGWVAQQLSRVRQNIAGRDPLGRDEFRFFFETNWLPISPSRHPSGRWFRRRLDHNHPFIVFNRHRTIDLDWLGLPFFDLLAPVSPFRQSRCDCRCSLGERLPPTRHTPSEINQRDRRGEQERHHEPSCNDDMGAGAGERALQPFSDQVSD